MRDTSVQLIHDVIPVYEFLLGLYRNLLKLLMFLKFAPTTYVCQLQGIS